jgi:hypothetical protein
MSLDEFRSELISRDANLTPQESAQPVPIALRERLPEGRGFRFQTKAAGEDDELGDGWKRVDCMLVHPGRVEAEIDW